MTVRTALGRDVCAAHHRDERGRSGRRVQHAEETHERNRTTHGEACEEPGQLRRAGSCSGAERDTNEGRQYVAADHVARLRQRDSRAGEHEHRRSAKAAEQLEQASTRRCTVQSTEHADAYGAEYAVAQRLPRRAQAAKAALERPPGARSRSLAHFRCGSARPFPFQ